MIHKAEKDVAFVDAQNFIKFLLTFALQPHFEVAVCRVSLIDSVFAQHAVGDGTERSAVVLRIADCQNSSVFQFNFA